MKLCFSYLIMICAFTFQPHALWSQLDYKYDELSPFSSINTGNVSTPILGDIDGDGDFDLFFGQYPSNRILFFRNIGNSEEAIYEAQIDENNPLDNYTNNTGCNSPKLLDIDGDGDLDAFVGTWHGAIRYYRNEGTSSLADFKPYYDADNPLNEVSTSGICSFPSFVDIDGDGDLDAFISDADGNIEFYKNTGNMNEPIFSKDKVNNPFNTFNFNSMVKLAFHDVSGDDLNDAVMAHESTESTLLYFRNTGTAENAVFEQVSSEENPFEAIASINSITPLFFDMDHDGDKDLILGDRGRVRMYTATENTSASDEFSILEEDILIYPNPSSGLIHIQGDDIVGYQLLSNNGRVISSSELRIDHNKINIADYATGIYYLKLISANSISIRKIIKN